MCLIIIFFLFKPNCEFVFLMSPLVVLPASRSPAFILLLGQLTGAHVFRALVVVCNEPSQINAACCHMRDWITTSNTEQMDTRVCLKTIFHWCCKLLSYCQWMFTERKQHLKLLLQHLVLFLHCGSFYFSCRLMMKYYKREAFTLIRQHT